MNYTKEQKNKVLRGLPENIQEVIVSMETFEKLKEISNAHNLHIDKMAELSDECVLVMLGLVKSAQFVDDLVLRLEVDHETAVAIVKEVNEKIFLPIREELRRVQMNDNSNSHPEENFNDVSKEDILNEIENPTKAPKVNVEKIEEKKTPIQNKGPNVEAIIDPRNELPAPTLINEVEKEHVMTDEEVQKVEVKTTVMPASTDPEYLKAIDKILTVPNMPSGPSEPKPAPDIKIPPKREYKADPYRESVK